MRSLTAPTLAVLLAGATSALSPALALQRAPQPGSAATLVRVADLERAPVRKARAHRHQRRHGHARRYWSVVPITSGHPLHRFRGDIEYRYLPSAYCCCCRGW